MDYWKRDNYGLPEDASLQAPINSNNPRPTLGQGGINKEFLSL